MIWIYSWYDDTVYFLVHLNFRRSERVRLAFLSHRSFIYFLVLVRNLSCSIPPPGTTRQRTAGPEFRAWARDGWASPWPSSAATCTRSAARTAAARCPPSSATTRAPTGGAPSRRWRRAASTSAVPCTTTPSTLSAAATTAWSSVLRSGLTHRCFDPASSSHYHIFTVSFLRQSSWLPFCAFNFFNRFCLMRYRQVV